MQVSRRFRNSRVGASPNPAKKSSVGQTRAFKAWKPSTANSSFLPVSTETTRIA